MACTEFVKYTPLSVSLLPCEYLHLFSRFCVCVLMNVYSGALELPLETVRSSFVDDSARRSLDAFLAPQTERRLEYVKFLKEKNPNVALSVLCAEAGAEQVKV